MADTNTAGSNACDREPIHVPEAIQPHGLLLVVDVSTDIIVQSAGNAEVLLGYYKPLLNARAVDVLGATAAMMVAPYQEQLALEPTYVGTLPASQKGEQLTMVAHYVGDALVIEIEPSSAQQPALLTLSQLRSAIKRMSRAPDLIDACQVAAAEIGRATGYDRVMVYRFLEDGSGTVVAEVKTAGFASFLHHRFSASDIPPQARALYKMNPIRVLPDVDYKPAELYPASPVLTRLDMSDCILRSMSAVHIQYLKNMGVRASMSVSLLPDGELWGLIACHNSDARLVSYEQREVCRHIGQMLSQHIKAREETARYRLATESTKAVDSLVLKLRQCEDPVAELLQQPDELMALAEATGVAIFVGRQLETAGHVPEKQQVAALGAWLLTHHATEVFSTSDLSKLYPDASHITSTASGVLSVVHPGDPPLVLAWFRPEEIEEITWAGELPETSAGATKDPLTPRKSFAAWKQRVKGKSRRWAPIETEAIRLFSSRLAYLIQQREIRVLNGLLTTANERLSVLSSTDGLTGIGNRRAFDDRLGAEWARGSRERKALALVIVDVDYFKQYNDHFGHVSGDQCLKLVASALQPRRSGDFAARFGGEEFCLLLPDTDETGAVGVAEALRARIADLKIDHPLSPFGIVTISAGVSVFEPTKSGSLQALLGLADQALYEAKRGGRNRVVFAHASD